MSRIGSSLGLVNTSVIADHSFRPPLGAVVNAIAPDNVETDLRGSLCCDQCATSGFKDLLTISLRELSVQRGLRQERSTLTQNFIWKYPSYAPLHECVFCRLLMSHFSYVQNPNSQEARTIFITRDTNGLHFNAIPPFDGASRRARGNQRYLNPPAIRPLQDNLASPDLQNYGRLQQGRVDINLVKKWMSLCETSHNCGDKTVGKLPSQATLRVVDVRSLCVIKAPPDCKYAALSYVWGGMNLSELSEGFSTAKERNYLPLKLPRSITDAIGLCKMLEIDYLWVDSLCIIQQDSTDKYQQIEHMHSVYGNSYLTIIAAAGKDANGGLPGIGLVPRRVNSLVIKSEGKSYIHTNKDPIQIMKNSHWYSRGWTFQELVLSRRSLIFTENLCFFHCSNVIWTEEIVLENSQIKNTPSVQESLRVLNLLRAPSKWRNNMSYFNEVYSPLLAEFTQRRLSRDEDAIAAFKGILQALQPVVGSFYWGVPERMLARGLLWKLHTNSYCDGPPADNRRREFPSWSWAGWRTRDGEFIDAVPQTLNIEQDSGVASTVSFYRLEEGSEPIHLPQSDEYGRHLQASYKVTNEMVYTQCPTLGQTPELQRKLLVFWASSAFLRVEPHPVPQNRPTYGMYTSQRPSVPITRSYKIYANHGRTLANIELLRSWRKRQPECLEFILVGQGRGNRCFIMLIERCWNGVVTRVAIPKHSIYMAEWERAMPQRSLILLS